MDKLNQLSFNTVKHVSFMLATSTAFAANEMGEVRVDGSSTVFHIRGKRV